MSSSLCTVAISLENNNGVALICSFFFSTWIPGCKMVQRSNLVPYSYLIDALVTGTKCNDVKCRRIS